MLGKSISDFSLKYLRYKQRTRDSDLLKNIHWTSVSLIIYPESAFCRRFFKINISNIFKFRSILEVVTKKQKKNFVSTFYSIPMVISNLSFSYFQKLFYKFRINCTLLEHRADVEILFDRRGSTPFCWTNMARGNVASTLTIYTYISFVSLWYLIQKLK